MRVAELQNYLQGDTHKGGPARSPLCLVSYLTCLLKRSLKAPKSQSNANQLFTFKRSFHHGERLSLHF